MASRPRYLESMQNNVIVMVFLAVQIQVSSHEEFLCQETKENLFALPYHVTSSNFNGQNDHGW